MAGSLEVTELTQGSPLLMSAVTGPDLGLHGYVEEEFRVSGDAPSYRAVTQPTDGRWEVVAADTARFSTRVLVRRPSDPVHFSGTAVVEWFNVSSGEDAGPDYTYVADEIVRQGHAWVGVSAQYVGVEGGRAAVAVPDLADAALGGLRNKAPERYQDLHHPGDAFCYGIYTAILEAVRTGEIGGVGAARVLAVGESQSAFALTTYANAIQPLTGAAHGFLVHSRGGAALPFGEVGAGVDLGTARFGEPTKIRDDLDVPVLIVQTETDLLSPRLRYLPARQDDSDLIRTWEIAGTAHADRWQIGEFEAFLGCADPVNTGQQAYVLRAALRALETWVRVGQPAPAAARLEVDEGGTAFLVDEFGNARGGVRTPIVDAPVATLTGLAAPEASVICSLFGRTLPAPAEAIRARYASADDYEAAYVDAAERAVLAGFVLAEDREAILAEARADLLGS